MKKFINHPENAVEEMLQGLSVLRPDLIRLAGHKVVMRADADQIRDRNVAIISGGGSGHEPAHAGYIGHGMLSAAVAGEIFTSPDTDSILAAIRAVGGRAGTLLVVKNYTGDRLNFGLAAEMARSEGYLVEMVVVYDDVALDGQESFAGARGLAGTIFVHKVAGAAAATGQSLADVVSAARMAIASLATMGVSFSAGTSPLVGRPSFELAEDEMELGLGIHGEPGVTRARLQSADELTETLLSRILKHEELRSYRRVAVMMNNLGATTEMELAIVARKVVPFLAQQNITVERMYAGTFLSSLDMAGISISLLGVDDARLRWLDAPTAAPSWPRAVASRPGGIATTFTTVPRPKTDAPAVPGNITDTGRKAGRAIEAACMALVDAEPELTEMDRIVGDGDLGASMKRGAQSVLAALDTYPLDDCPATLKAIGHTLRHELGGSSGPLYGVFFLRSSSVLASSRQTGLQLWAEALEAGCSAISELGGARPGDRTMLDALVPFVQSLKSAGNRVLSDVLPHAMEEAVRGAAATASMKPRLGRSSYLGNRVLGHPDPGAMAAAMWLRAACNALLATGLTAAA